MPFGIGDNGNLFDYRVKDFSFWVGHNVINLSHQIDISDKIIYIFDFVRNEVKSLFFYPFTNYYGVMPGDIHEKIFFYFAGVSPWRPEEAEAMFNIKPDTGHIMIHDIVTGKIYNIYFNELDEHSRNDKLISGSYVLGEDENIYYQLVTDKAYFIYRITPLWSESMEKSEYKPYFFEFLPDIKKEWDSIEKGVTK